jgi:cell division protein FtsW
MKRQIFNLAIALGACAFFSFFDYKKLYYLSFPLLIGTIISLVFVLIPGVGSTALGAQRWINILGFNFQPTELAKFTIIMYLSSWFLYKEKGRFASFLILMGTILGLIMIQPDLGTTIIIFSLFVSIYYFSGENIMKLVGLAPFAMAGVAFLVLSSPYRLQRVRAFIDPNVDPEGVSYHIRQILISLSSGGIFGRGFSSSRQKYQFLPEAHTDSIFAIIGEEVGFLGSILVIAIYVAFLYILYRAAQQTHDRFGKLLIGAVFTLIGLQLIINLGGMVNLIPLTGIPLPFISYGGSSLLVFYSLMGVVINVARRNKI